MGSGTDIPFGSAASAPEAGVRMIAMVATKKQTELAFEAIRDEMLRRFAPMALAIELFTADGKASLGGLLFSVGGVLITVLFIEHPIPKAEVDEAAKGSRIGWPTAGDELAKHRAHAIVAMVNPANDHGGVLNGAAYVTLVAAAIAALSPAIGVYWSTARAVQSVPDFMRGAEKLARREIPTDTWVRLDLLQGSLNPDDGLLAAITIGLQPFVGRELEFEPQRLPPLTIAQRMVGTVQYLILNGMVLSDGDTLGVDQSERIRVRFAAQGQRPGVPVARLSVERMDPTTQH